MGDAFRGKLDATQRRDFLAVWKSKGEAPSLAAFLQTHGPDWEKAALAGK